MIHSLTRSIVCGLIVLSLVPTVELITQQGRPLPSFAIATADGEPASSDGLVREGAWVLVFTQMPCRACDAALAAIDETLSPEQAMRVSVIVSAASSAQVTDMRSRLVNLAGAGWYRDDAKAALAALGVTGAPVVVGLQGNRVLWTRNVAALSAAAQQSLVMSWIR
jgi:hypothetical protein